MSCKFLRVNRTHLFRMNVDLRAMEARAAELKAQMRDVLARKLGRPRAADRALDELLRRLARRHKFAGATRAPPHLLQQLDSWIVSNRLRILILIALHKFTAATRARSHFPQQLANWTISNTLLLLKFIA